MTRLAFAVFISTALASASAFAACPDGQPLDSQASGHRAKKHPQADSCVNLNTLPQISAQGVAAEPAPIAKAPGYTPPTPTAYEGPTLGMSKPEPAVRAVPTVGYKWSLQ